MFFSTFTILCNFPPWSKFCLSREKQLQRTVFFSSSVALTSIVEAYLEYEFPYDTQKQEKER